MNVLVADDEEKVCNLICALIDWKRLGLNLCGTAYDGISALSLIKEKKPDLVITDIRMPGLDGLELIKQAKEFNESLEFIIISGHRQFDYARTAIKYGVADYLLKPIKQQELEQTISKMIARHIQKESLQKTSDFLLQKVNESKEQERGRAIKELIEQDNVLSLEKCFFFSDFARFLSIKVDYSESPEAGFLLKDKIDELLKREYETIYKDIAVYLWGNYILILISYKSQLDDLLLNKTTLFLLSFLKTQTEIFQGLSFTIGVGLAVTDVKDLKNSLLSSKQVLSRRLVEGCMNKYVSEKFEPPIPGQYCIEFFSTLEDSFAKESLELLRDNCLSLLKKISSSSLSPYAHQQILFDCFSRLVSFIRQQNVCIAETEKAIEKGYSCLDNARTLVLLDAVFCESVENLFVLFIEHAKQTISKPIRLAQQLIAKQYSDERLSLEAISDQVNLNSSYFSALFKKNCSIGFGEYLQDIRIKQAKQLLTETTHSISEISQKVGYHDPKHFAKVFKKACKIKPNEFRKLYG
ncbi:response regulator [uncultured Sphaerochaeta sp.]|uniref:response regulator transcription factor n=1 Tax=uncultured Sphaerochaeta sp. TaxID=886478 RepID=UPI002A0A3CFE|nr:response regulator [uncultured Sphaerochaeta sp.]